ncbi:hypothetical protein JRQ81_001440 [Phrynocephalus forsythii]|uniref:Uncharacterized protein n=1 Tax=Phrynocephalus forsythii TaxID=171643 RepID=A0A9Q0Y776_9SAUR|nr:hypothetical protein JRQ81_001440 [Phrynocephalus forsythii]
MAEAAGSRGPPAPLLLTAAAAPKDGGEGGGGGVEGGGGGGEPEVPPEPPLGGHRRRERRSGVALAGSAGLSGAPPSDVEAGLLEAARATPRRSSIIKVNSDVVIFDENQENLK